MLKFGLFYPCICYTSPLIVYQNIKHSPFNQVQVGSVKTLRWLFFQTVFKRGRMLNESPNFAHRPTDCCHTELQKFHYWPSMSRHVFPGKWLTYCLFPTHRMFLQVIAEIHQFIDAEPFNKIQTDSWQFPTLHPMGPPHSEPIVWCRLQFSISL